MTLYELNQICHEPLVVYTMYGDEKICIFTQCNYMDNLPALFEECDVREIWCDNDLITVLI